MHVIRTYDFYIFSGLGSSTSDLLAKKGITTITDLQATNLSQLTDLLSPEIAQKLIDFSFGKDDSPVKVGLS